MSSVGGERPLFETAADLDALQQLIDRSYASAGTNLRRIYDHGRRLTATDVAQRLQGVCLLAVATTTSDGRPIVSGVDGIFYRGAFHFGSMPDSLRVRHLRVRPHVSATHLPDEALAITVHGTAAFVDHAAPEHAALRRALLDIYVPRYGDSWEADFLDAGPVYTRVDARRMFTWGGPA